MCSCETEGEYLKFIPKEVFNDNVTDGPYRAFSFFPKIDEKIKKFKFAGYFLEFIIINKTATYIAIKNIYLYLS